MIKLQIGKPVRACLASAVDSPAKTVFKWLPSAYALEPKIDGVRCQVHKQGTDVRLFTRNLKDITANFQNVVKKIASIPHDLILDGELVVIDKNKISPFLDLMRQFTKANQGQFIGFDVLQLGDDNLAERPYLQRREVLEQLGGSTSF